MDRLLVVYGNAWNNMKTFPFSKRRRAMAHRHWNVSNVIKLDLACWLHHRYWRRKEEGGWYWRRRCWAPGNGKIERKYDEVTSIVCQINVIHRQPSCDFVTTTDGEIKTFNCDWNSNLPIFHALRSSWSKWDSSILSTVGRPLILCIK